MPGRAPGAGRAAGRAGQGARRREVGRLANTGVHAAGGGRSGGTSTTPRGARSGGSSTCGNWRAGVCSSTTGSGSATRPSCTCAPTTRGRRGPRAGSHGAARALRTDSTRATTTRTHSRGTTLGVDAEEGTTRRRREAPALPPGRVPAGGGRTLPVREPCPGGSAHEGLDGRVRRVRCPGG